MTGFHHIELWITDIDNALAEWGWLLSRVGFEPTSSWEQGQSWMADGAYLTLTTSPNTNTTTHDRRRPGLNHIAFQAGTAADIDLTMAEAPAHGWKHLYHDRYPHAGGPEHYAGWLENSAGFKAEVVAEQFVPSSGDRH